MPPALLTALFWSSESTSYCRYSVGLDRPSGSKPRSPGREPSSLGMERRRRRRVV